MRFLVLGGTKFIGRQVVEGALERGHDVTLFHRGHTGAELFPRAGRILGDRGGDLSGLAEGEWDAVFDFSGYLPDDVGRTVELLADRVGHYTYMSSIAVYRDRHLPGVDEDGRMAEMPPDVPAGFSWDAYGPRKVLCERAVAAAYPGRYTAIRSGLVTGPGDTGDALLEWALAMADDDVVSCAAAPDQAVQAIDVRDLADFMLLATETGRTGAYNAVGPLEPLTFADMLATCRDVSGGHAVVDWSGDRTGFIVQPADGSRDGTFQLSFARALAAGLRLRPFAETARDAIAFARNDPSRVR
jgi:2'-hydroxyisoflavone reductase